VPLSGGWCWAGAVAKEDEVEGPERVERDEEVQGAGSVVEGFGGLGVVAGPSSSVKQLECSSLPVDDEEVEGAEESSVSESSSEMRKKLEINLNYFK